LPQSGDIKLAWKMEVTWNNGSADFGRDIVFFDAYNNGLLTRHAQVHSVKTGKRIRSTAVLLRMRQALYYVQTTKAEQIFYRALSTYMTLSTNFAGARTDTAQAAQDLYGATEKAAVEKT
jgi:hypothetical protein